MIDLILFITVIAVWLGSIWLYFFIDRLLDDVRAIDADLQNIKKDLQQITVEAKKASEQIKGDEFLGI